MIPNITISPSSIISWRRLFYLLAIQIQNQKQRVVVKTNKLHTYYNHLLTISSLTQDNYHNTLYNTIPHFWFNINHGYNDINCSSIDKGYQSIQTIHAITLWVKLAHRCPNHGALGSSTRHSRQKSWMWPTGNGWTSRCSTSSRAQLLEKSFPRPQSSCHSRYPVIPNSEIAVPPTGLSVPLIYTLIPNCLPPF